jgi:type III secretion system FlhB-like substrate exporter
MRLIIGTKIGKRCLHTLLQPKPFIETSSWIQRQQSSTLSFGRTAFTYYITAVAAVSTLFRTSTTTTALYTQPKPEQLLYRPVLVRRIATASTFWNSNTARSTTTKRNMSSPTIIRDNGTITITPKKETDQSALIVIAHGLGDSAEGFVDVAEVRHQTVDMTYLELLIFVLLSLLIYLTFFTVF